MAVYSAMIDRMDYGVGRVLARLREMGEEQNTLVLFLSDNGACHENIAGRKLNQPGTLPGERGSYVAYRRPWANYSNTPFRMFKHWIQEGGISSPLIARWPAVIKQKGTISDEVGHIIDIMPTLAEVGGAAYPERFNGRDITPTEGLSLLPLFEGGSRPGHEALYWEHEGNRAVRRGKWKLVAKRNAPWELYDMAADRVELNDLSRKMPILAAELENLYSAWAEKVGVGRR
jgi:arylsulfatase